MTNGQGPDRRLTPPGSELRPIFLRVPPEQIVYLKFILESYDGLGVVRTLDPEAAIIVVLALADTEAEADRLLESLGREIRIERLSAEEIRGKNGCEDLLHGDWLLAEHLKDER